MKKVVYAIVIKFKKDQSMRLDAHEIFEEYEKAETKILEMIEKQNPKGLEIYYSELEINDKGTIIASKFIDEKENNSQLLHSC